MTTDKKVQVEKIIQDIEQKFDVLRLNSIATYAEKGDIDLFIRKGSLDGFIEYLFSHGFLIRINPGCEAVGYIFLHGELYAIGVKQTSDTILTLFPHVHLNEDAFETAIWKDPDLERFFRYVLQLRNLKPKYAEFVQAKFDKYRHYLSDQTYLSKPILRRDASLHDVLGAMQHNVVSMLRVFPFTTFVKLLGHVLKRKVRNLNRGKIIAFVGSDGAGKTTVITKIKDVHGARTVHMGDGSIWFRDSFARLYNGPTSIARLTYLVIFIEHWWRYIKIRWWKIKGITVFVDRWPGMNRHLCKSGIWQDLNRLIYAAFPDPDAYIFLHAPSNVIRARKSDLSEQEIEYLQKTLRERLQTRIHYEIESGDIDTVLMEVLRITFRLRGFILR